MTAERIRPSEPVSPFASATALVEALSQREVSSRELLEHYLERVERYPSRAPELGRDVHRAVEHDARFECLEMAATPCGRRTVATRATAPSQMKTEHGGPRRGGDGWTHG